MSNGEICDICNEFIIFDKCNIFMICTDKVCQVCLDKPPIFDSYRGKEQHLILPPVICNLPEDDSDEEDDDEEDKPLYNICCGCGKYKNTGTICDCGCSHREKCVECLKMEEEDDDDEYREFWDEAGEMFGYKITEGHPMKEAFELFKEMKFELMKKEQEEDGTED
jgi:hypothetical protein